MQTDQDLNYEESWTSSNSDQNKNGKKSSSDSNNDSRSSSFHTNVDPQTCYGIVSIDVVIETDHYFYLLQPYYPYTLHDVVAFSPTILEMSHARPLFLTYQLLHALQSLHGYGLHLGEATISDIVMDKNMWLRVSCPRLSALEFFERNDLKISDSETGSLYVTANSTDSLNKTSTCSFNSEPSLIQRQV